jgi:hypothetical protein
MKERQRPFQERVLSTSYEFNTASYAVEELSEVFCVALGLERVKPLAASPISGASWWASVASLKAAEFRDESARLQASEAFTSITFEPRKSMSWKEETEGLVRIAATVVDLLSREPDTTGFLEFYDEIIVLEKRRGSRIVVDPRLVDPDDLDDLHAFSRTLSALPFEPIEQFGWRKAT